jgi:glycerophosphoryl diester phosphodiesterase
MPTFYLDDANVPADLPTAEQLKAYRAQGVRSILAPPLWALLTADGVFSDWPATVSSYANCTGQK